MKLCGRCSRPLYLSKGPYCMDCSLIEASSSHNPRCSFCGKNKLASTLHYNLKRNNVYCVSCLQVFLDELNGRGFEEKVIRKIVREDFIPMR